MTTIVALKSIDRIIGQSLCRLILRPRFEMNEGNTRRILVIRPGGIGDAVLLASAINSLKSIYPHSHISILAEQRNADVFALIHGVDEVFRYDIPREFIEALRGRYDVVIDTEQWHRLSAVVARLVRAPIKIGFDTNERRRMFTHVIPYDLAAYEPHNFLALLKPLGMDCPLDGITATLSVPLESVSKATRLLRPLNSAPYVVIFPGASVPEKRWGADRYALVAKRLSEEGYRVVVAGGREDRPDGDLIVGAGIEGLNLAGATTLAETAAVIARSCLVVSGDSGVLHLAVGMGIPTVSLFGPGSTAKWAPRGENHVVLNLDISCSPCTQFGTIPHCINDARCMKEITADQVMVAAVSLLDYNSVTRQQYIANH